SSRPYRAIGPPSALPPAVISHFRQLKNHQFNPLYTVLKQLLVSRCSRKASTGSLVTPSNLAAALAIDPPIPGISPGAQVYNKNTVIVGKPGEWYNPHMFTLPAYGILGDVPRGVLRGPGLADWDFWIN
ncbi:MAG: hypothetical protein ACRD5K_16280, partial [Candidatus Acidiferrales bacterium]